MDFILRIEDTDKARNITGKEEEIKEILHLLAFHGSIIMYKVKI